MSTTLPGSLAPVLLQVGAMEVVVLLVLLAVVLVGLAVVAGIAAAVWFLVLN